MISFFSHSQVTSIGYFWIMSSSKEFVLYISVYLCSEFVSSNIRSEIDQVGQHIDIHFLNVSFTYIV